MEHGASETILIILTAFGLGLLFGYLIWAGRRYEAAPAPRYVAPPAPAEPAVAAPGAAAAGASPAPAPEPAPAAEAAPQPAPTPAAEPPAPAQLFAERPETVDDLQKIKGIGPKMAAVLNERGVYQYAQLAAFTAEDLRWLDAATGSFPGRAERDDWVGQARALLAAG